jgi:hypothetical protein
MRYEEEDKYLIERIPDNYHWDRRVLVYQFFLEIQEKKSHQLKIVFNFKAASINAYYVDKEVISPSESIKESRKVDLSEIDLNKLIGVKFVLKKRAIDEPYFLDTYVVPAGKTVLEIEGRIPDETNHIFGRLKCVSNNTDYLNEFMAVEFTEENRKQLLFLVNIFY